MTVIAYRDGVMASDSAVWCDDHVAGHTRKIYRVAGGRLFGASGSSVEIRSYVAWINAGMAPSDKPKLRPVSDELSIRALLVGPGIADVLRIEADCEPIAIGGDSEYYVVGAHNEFLRGVLAFGASAEGAVTVALEVCAYARGRVQVERLD